MSKPKKVYKRPYYLFYFDGGTYKGDKWDIAEQIEKSTSIVSYYLSQPTDERYGWRIGTKWPVYEFYRKKTGEYVGTGSPPDVAEKLNVRLTTLEKDDGIRKVFTGEYKIVEDDEMRVKRTSDKYAPIMTEDKYEPVKKEKLIISKPVEPAEFKVGRYAQSLHDSYFAKWNLKEG